MRVVVIGSGLVGRPLGRALRSRGDHVTLTTTTPSRVAGLSGDVDRVAVVVGSDRAAVAAVSEGADAVVVTAGPSASRAMTREDRAASYREVLVDTADSVVGAPGSPHLVMLSSLMVYGGAADHLDVVTEDAPTTTSDDPSPRCFLAAESTYLGRAGERSCVLRCADITGPGDPPIEDKVRLAHESLGGSVPFAAATRFYRVHVDDVVAALLHVLDLRLTGTYHLVAGDPPTNRELFDAISAAQGLPPLTYRGELVGPARPVSMERLAATGFRTRLDPFA